MITLMPGWYNAAIQNADKLANSDEEFFFIMQCINATYEANGGVLPAKEYKT